MNSLIENNGNLFKISSQRSNCDTLYIEIVNNTVDGVGLHQTTSISSYVERVNKVDLMQPCQSGDVTQIFFL